MLPTMRRIRLNVPNRSAVVYSACMMTAGALGFAKVFVYAALLDSTWFGLYGLGVLLSSFGITLCQLGVCRGLDGLLPTLYGGGRMAEAHRLRNASAGFVLVCSLALIVLTAAAGLLSAGVSGPTRWVLVAAAWVAAANALLGLGLQDQRSRGRTVSFGVVFLAKAVLNLACGVGVASTFGCVGILAAEALVAFSLFLVVARWDAPGFQFAWPSWILLGPLMRTGTPLLLKNVLNDLALSLDRWFIPIALGMAALGQYSFGLLPVSAAMLIHNMIWSSVGPRAALTFGQDRDIQRVFRHLHRWSVGLFTVAAVVWIPVQWLGPPLITALYPNYGEGASLLPILYWGAAFQLVSLYDWVPMVLQRTTSLMYVTLCGLAVSALALLLAVTFSWQLSTFAWIFVIGRATATTGQAAVAVLLVRRLGAGAASPIVRASPDAFTSEPATLQPPGREPIAA